MTADRVIGKDGKIPWRLADDLEWFKRVTTGNIVVMGRKTAESLPGRKPLPGRRNIVITRDVANAREGLAHRQEDDGFVRKFTFFHGGVPEMAAEDLIREISMLPRKDGPAPVLFVIGGAETYANFLPFADELLLTEVLGSYQGDAYFPEMRDFIRASDLGQWKDLAMELEIPTIRVGHAEEFIVSRYTRKHEKEAS